LKDDQKKIITLENFSDNDYIFKRRYVDSGYKIYNKGFTREFILAEAKISSFVNA